ncbi:peptide ABC transporter substrate-binding protein [Clostridium botulinum]|uniref:peptide ABC transporter substrate-binding protein n=1 Tax=Clostridium botulinum TaxID=1491 RepID=UPI0004D520E9|nr:peptide ABC transporter substrate-binding protein [Clostridium botulinum]KEI03487.1 peptide ABC transporter substrate-binding protein [Clostridium botulinum C/D str. BKT75002]KEI08874.1 peptide ABC transporter substrate-binding protein [Clostridium botulinum C/D str. BKT2873]MCD3351958.1 peptide ABC transporter substrate-binding protein [Clostridium botulinum D/C]MCD3360906.1 peptide ABC transporter substrate-binding protein [Clostridium botulinum D/C]MCD3363220.1 peptide ABC transporter su
MKKRLLSVVLISTLASTLLLSGCGNNKTAQKGGKLNIDLQEIKTLDSGQVQDNVSATPINAAFEGLVRVNNFKVELAMAKECKVSKDKKTYTFTLKDSKWTDGKAVTAKDFEYAWKRLVNPKTKAAYSTFLNGIVKNADKISNGKLHAEKLGVKAKDDKTLVVNLEKPVPYFEEMTSFMTLFPIRKDIVEVQGEKYGSDPSKMVFNGPYIIESWQKGGKTILKKNKTYYSANDVKIDEIVFQDIKEQPTKYQMFKSKQLDCIEAIGEYRNKLKKDSNEGECILKSEKSPRLAFIAFNMNGKNKLLTNAKIRKALSVAIDRETYVNKIYKRGYTAYGLIPDTIKCNGEEFRKEVSEPLKYILKEKINPRELFIEGLKELKMDLDPSKYTFKYMAKNSDAFEKQTGEYFQEQWKNKIGINIILNQPASFADYISKYQSGEFELAMGGWGADYNDPSSMTGIFLKDDGNNASKYYNPAFDNIAMKANNETNAKNRINLYKKAEEIIVCKDSGLAPVYYKDLSFAEQKYVKGIQYPAFGSSHEFRWASIEK